MSLNVARLTGLLGNLFCSGMANSKSKWPCVSAELPPETLPQFRGLRVIWQILTRRRVLYRPPPVRLLRKLTTIETNNTTNIIREELAFERKRLLHFPEYSRKDLFGFRKCEYYFFQKYIQIQYFRLNLLF